MLYSRKSKTKVRSRTTLLVVGASVSALLLSSCGVANPDDSVSNAGSDTVRIVLPQEPTNLDACESTLTSTSVVIRTNVVESLVNRDAKTGELQPLLATGWEATGEKEWTFTLREGVTFHDGTAFNADAAVFSINRTVNSDLPCNAAGFFSGATIDAEAIDDTTLRLTTEAADPILPLRMSFIAMASAATAPDEIVREAIGTGPYVIDQWDAGQKLTLKRNDSYWGDLPTFPVKAEYQWRAEGTIRAGMVTTGEAEIAMDIGPDDGAGDLGKTFQNNETVALRFSGEIAPLNDIRVRRAINYAIDKEAINAGLYDGVNDVASQLMPPGTLGYNEGIEPWPFDMDKAKDLVAKAKADGVPVDEKITVIARNAQFPKVTEMAQIIEAQMSEAGLNVKIQMVDAVRALEFQMRPHPTDQGAIALLVQHGNSAGDAAFTVERNMLSDGLQSAFGNAELDAMLTEAATRSGDKRQRAYAAALEYQNESIVQWANLIHMTGMIAVADSVSFEPNNTSRGQISLVDITPAN